MPLTLADASECRVQPSSSRTSVSGKQTQTAIVERFDAAISRLAIIARQVAEAQSKLELALRTRKFVIPACTHAEGHEISLRPREALSVEASRECPCCYARLWISVPSVGMLLEIAALNDKTYGPGLDAVLTRRERQVLNVLRSSPYPLRAGQLAALVWSDPHRTHDVRSALHRLRNKLRDSGWAIPFAEKGGGVRLVEVSNGNRQTTPKPIDDDLAVARRSLDSAAA